MVDQLNRRIRQVPSWLVYVLGLTPAVWQIYLGVTDQLGPDPVRILEHGLGETGLKFLIAGLAITPLRRVTRVNLMKHRRAIGLIAFFYVLLHLLVWLFLDVQILSRVIDDILKRPYITVGMAGFVLMVPLALTSNNWSMRKLGPRWRQLHRLTYAVCLLGGLHFVLLAKGFQLEPLIYLGLTILLLVARLRWVQSVTRNLIGRFPIPG